MFMIKTHVGLVDRFYNAMQIIQTTNNPDMAKKFKTEKAAIKWAEKYANNGYGLVEYEIMQIIK